MAWDLDGDGRFEQAPAPCEGTQVQQHTYTKAGTYKVTVDASYRFPLFGFGVHDGRGGQPRLRGRRHLHRPAAGDRR